VATLFNEKGPPLLYYRRERGSREPIKKKNRNPPSLNWKWKKETTFLQKKKREIVL